MRLTDIIANMRSYADRLDSVGGMPSPTDLRTFADGIDAAAERERDEDRQLAAIAESDEAFARCARCDRPERAPGNAAMREALVEILDRTNREKARDRDAALNGGIIEIHDIANTALLTASAALVAPPTPPSDAAKMREAILAIKELNDRRPHDAAGYEINDIIEEALAGNTEKKKEATNE